MYLGSGNYKNKYSYEMIYIFLIDVQFFCPPLKKYKGELTSTKKTFFQSFGIMKHSAKYEHCGIT